MTHSFECSFKYLTYNVLLYCWLFLMSWVFQFLYVEENITKKKWRRFVSSWWEWPTHNGFRVILCSTCRIRQSISGDRIAMDWHWFGFRLKWHICSHSGVALFQFKISADLSLLLLNTLTHSTVVVWRVICTYRI